MRVGRLFIVASVLGPLLMPTPAQAASSLIDAGFRSVRLISNGSVRVLAEYTCPDGYAAAHEGTRLLVYQMQHTQVYASKVFDNQVICDGTPQTVAKRVHPPEGRFYRRFLLDVELDLYAKSGADSYPYLWTREFETNRIAPGGEAGRVADIRLGQVRLNAREELIVGVEYECPAGWYVDSEDDIDWADISGGQQTSNGAEIHFFETLVFDITCDDQAHTIVKRISTNELVSREFPLRVEAKMILRERGTQRRIHADEALTLPLKEDPITSRT